MKKNTLIVSIALILSVAISSCAHEVKLIEVLPNNPNRVDSTWVINSFKIDQRVPDRELEKQLPEVLVFLGEKYGVTIQENLETASVDGPRVLCDIWIKEQVYSQSLNQYNSIAAIISLSDPQTKEVLVRAVYSEESEASIKSFHHLFGILDELVASLAAKTR